MGAYDGLQLFFNGGLRDYASEYGYDKSNLIILDGNLEALQQHFPNIYINLLSCSHQSDYRGMLQYARDLVASWVFEDFIMRELNDSTLSICLAGADRNRIILPSNRTSTSSDFIVATSFGKESTLELMNDYSGFWGRKHLLHLRDNKYKKLLQNQGLLLAISLSNLAQTYSIFDFRLPIPAKYIPYHNLYGKPAYELPIPSSIMYDFSLDEIDSLRDHLLYTLNQEE